MTRKDAANILWASFWLFLGSAAFGWAWFATARVAAQEPTIEVPGKMVVLGGFFAMTDESGRALFHCNGSEKLDHCALAEGATLDELGNAIVRDALKQQYDYKLVMHSLTRANRLYLECKKAKP